MILDPTKTYLTWSGTTFPNSASATFKAPAGSTIDWGDGTVQTFDTEDTNITTHTYSDGKTEHTIAISGLTGLPTSSFYGCNGLTSAIIGNSVVSIGGSVFRGCSNLTSITIPNSVNSLGSAVFANDSNLTSIIIPDSITIINDNSFNYCTSLTSAIIPESVTSIEAYAFYSCNNLKIIALLSETPPTLVSTNAIPTTTTIYVPQSAKEAYKTAANWSTFADKIEANDIYLSLIRFNKKNKEYIGISISDTKEYVDTQVSTKDMYTYTYSFSTADINMANETITFIAPLIPHIKEATTRDQIRACIANFLISKKYNNDNNVLPCTGNIGYNVNERGIPYGLYIDSSGNLTAVLTKYDFTTGTSIIDISDTGAAGSLRYSKLN